MDEALKRPLSPYLDFFATDVANFARPYGVEEINSPMVYINQAAIKRVTMKHVNHNLKICLKNKMSES